MPRRSLKPRSNQPPLPYVDPKANVAPEPRDSRYTARQLVIGQGASILAPPLPSPVEQAIVEASAPGYCRVLWCDADAVRSGECDRHATETEDELHRQLGRLQTTSTMRKPKRLRR